MVVRKKYPAKVFLGLRGAFRSPNSVEGSLKASKGNPLTKYLVDFHKSQECVLKEVSKAVFKFSQQPLFAAFLSWIEEMRLSNPEIFNYVHTLVKENPGFFRKNKIYLTIADVKDFDHEAIIDEIRSRKDLSLDLREKLVTTYLSFIRWLQIETHGYISRAIDPDESKRQGRGIHYSMFIKLLDCLDDKMQLVAKLLYFGGSRTLDEVLSLQLEDVDYQQKLIRYDLQLISYPKHVFSDIKVLTQERSTGRVFLGRQNANLNPATVFRNFKEAASQVGLGESFSPKSLTTNV